MALDDGIRKIETFLSEGLTMQGNNLSFLLLQEYPENIRLLQLYGLSLARLGAVTKAQKVLEKAYSMDPENCESAGIMGRIYKDLYKLSGATDYAKKSVTTYLEGYRKTGSYYPGINAAMMLLVTGEQEKSEKLAEEIITLIGSSPHSYWELATLGEASLLLGNEEKAEKYYASAKKKAEHRIGDVNSSYQQLLFVNKYRDVPQKIFDIMAPPTIVCFSGHMIDAPEREKPRFPNEIAEQVKKEIKKVLDRENAGIGYCSGACGADILFIEALLERGGEVNVVLPFRKDEFIKTSVAFAGDHWVERFENALDRSLVSYITEESFYGGDNIYRTLGRVIMGRCILRSKHLASHPLLMTVLETGSERKAGGTADNLMMWPFENMKTNIDPTNFLKTVPSLTTPSTSENTVWKPEDLSLPEGISHSIKCILFADVVGYSKLQEDQTPFFMYEVASRNFRKNKNTESSACDSEHLGRCCFCRL